MMIVGGRVDRVGRGHARERNVEEGDAIIRHTPGPSTSQGEDVLSSSHEGIFTSEVLMLYLLDYYVFLGGEKGLD